ncbi:MAG TPA: hypothetical protein PKC30_14650, partial [Saprospiraceae bacterium]|nr:hypothetical protein [Saprospiraceae bacterium]
MVISIQRIGRVLQLSMGLSLGMALYSLYLWGQGKCTDVDLFLEGIYYTSGGAFAGGILLGLTTYGTKFFDGFRYYIHSGLRYGLVYMLVTYAMSVLLDISFPDSLMSLERKVADISSQDLVWVFFGHTYTYQAFIGWMQIAGCGLLLFRATAPAGLLIHLAIMSNVFIIQRSYGLCQQYEAIIYLATVTFLLLPFVRNLINVLLLNKPTITLERMEWAVGIHAYRATAVLKLILLMGIAILYYNKTRRFHRYYFANSNSPFIGVWNIDQIEYQPDQDS